MIVNLNGWPGVGKLTIGLELAELLGARLLDNHSLLNIAIALTDYPGPAYYEAARALRDIAFRYARALPPGTPLIVTSVNASGGPSGFAEEHWIAVRDLAQARGVPLLSITLECSPDERARRVVEPGRRVSRKLRDPAVIERMVIGRALFDDGADHRLVVDTTHCDAKTSAGTIAAWIRDTVPVV
ncbi:MAG: AAA family ATPase [Sphingomonas sp.]|uniref:AAA family ATPase n=1 Tax=Sphingomonas sp. TaxID=28214 RepID=UPI003563CD53